MKWNQKTLQLVILGDIIYVAFFPCAPHVIIGFNEGASTFSLKVVSDKHASKVLEVCTKNQVGAWQNDLNDRLLLLPAT